MAEPAWDAGVRTGEAGKMNRGPTKGMVAGEACQTAGCGTGGGMEPLSGTGIAGEPAGLAASGTAAGATRMAEGRGMEKEAMVPVALEATGGTIPGPATGTAWELPYCGMGCRLDGSAGRAAVCGMSRGSSFGTAGGTIGMEEGCGIGVPAAASPAWKGACGTTAGADGRGARRAPEESMG